MGKSVQHLSSSPFSSSSKRQRSVTYAGQISQLPSFSKPGRRSFQLKKHKKQHAQVEQPDHITKLPDELLCDIISHLTLAEAARAGVLARRWNKLWYHFHGALEFDDTKKLEVLPQNTVKQAVHGYLSSNRQLLQLMPSPLFSAFRITCCNMDEVCSSHIDFCVQFALTKRIKTFELDISPTPILSDTDTCYNFPFEFYAWIKKPCGLDNISSLTTISLGQVNVSDDLINHLLVNCTLLESLRVRGSLELLNPKFIGGKLKLKYLEIWGLHLESIEICAPNLSTFITRSFWTATETDRKRLNLLIKNAPKLVEMCIPVHLVKHSPKAVSSYLPQLEKLTWDFSSVHSIYKSDLIQRFLKQNKLLHLTWKVNFYDDACTAELNSLLEVSPFLQKFTLVSQLEETCTSYKDKVPSVTAKRPHDCLKVLEIEGFTGTDAEVRLVRYFLANTSSLEQIILDTIGPFYRGILYKGEPSLLRRGKKRALELKQCLPPRVSLVILEE